MYSKPQVTPQVAGEVSEGPGVQLQLQADFSGGAERQLVAVPAAPMVAELFAVLSSVLGFYEDTAGSWSRYGATCVYGFAWALYPIPYTLYPKLRIYGWMI